MVEIKIDVEKNTKTSVSAQDFSLHTIELEGYNGSISLKSQNDYIRFSISRGVSIPEIYQKALLCLESIKNDIDKAIKQVKEQIGE